MKTPIFPKNWQFPLDSNYILNGDCNNFQGNARHNPSDPNHNIFNPGWFYEAPLGTPVYLVADKPAGRPCYKYTSAKYGICCMINYEDNLWVNYYNLKDTTFGELCTDFMPMGTVIGHSDKIHVEKGEYDYQNTLLADTPFVLWCIAYDRVCDDQDIDLIDPTQFAGYPLPIKCRLTRDGGDVDRTYNFTIPESEPSEE